MLKINVSLLMQILLLSVFPTLSSGAYNKFKYYGDNLVDDSPTWLSYSAAEAFCKALGTGGDLPLFESQSDYD